MKKEYIEIKIPNENRIIYIQNFDDYNNLIKKVKPDIKYVWNKKESIIKKTKETNFCPECDSKLGKDMDGWFCDYCDEYYDENSLKIKKNKITEYQYIVGFLYDNMIHAFQIPKTYLTLRDFEMAWKEGFGDFDFRSWQIIKKMNYKNRIEFDNARGNYSLDQWIKIKKLGYKTWHGFENAKGKYDLDEWIKIKNAGYKNSKKFEKDCGDLTIDQWIKLREFGFKDHMEFRRAEKMGFVGVSYKQNGKKYFYTNKEEYEDRYHYYNRKVEWLKDIDYVELNNFRDAKKGGFNNRQEFLDAKGNGFDNLKEWVEFKDSKFDTKENFLKAKEFGIKELDTFKVFNFLKTFEPGIPIAISSITEKTGVKKKILNKICCEKPISDLGNYIEGAGNFLRDGELNTKKIFNNNFKKGKYKSAILDGMNLAHDENKKVKLKRILVCSEKLKNIGINPIILVSGTFRHRLKEQNNVKDLKKFENMMKNGEIIQTSPDEYDDTYILQFAINENAYIISNDKFDDWKENNPERAKEIDARRIGFTYLNDEKIEFGGDIGILKKPKRKK